MDIDIKSGDLLYVDVIPELNEDGSLTMAEDQKNPSVMYDYTVNAPMKSQKGDIARYSIKRRE